MREDAKPYFIGDYTQSNTLVEKARPYKSSMDPEHVRKRNESITINMLVGKMTVPAYNAYHRKNEPGVWYDADTHEQLSTEEFTRRVKDFQDRSREFKQMHADRRAAAKKEERRLARAFSRENRKADRP